jgi:hypothetical protein
MAKLLHKLRKFNYVPHATARSERGVILGPIMKPRPQPSIGRMLYLNRDQNRYFLRHFHLHFIFAANYLANWEARPPVLASRVHPNRWIFRSATTKI